MAYLKALGNLGKYIGEKATYGAWKINSTDLYCKYLHSKLAVFGPCWLLDSIIITSKGMVGNLLRFAEISLHYIDTR